MRVEQYSKYLVIQQLSETETVLRVNDRKLVGELKQRLPSIYTHYLSEITITDTPEEYEYHFIVSNMDIEAVKWNLSILTPSNLDSLSSN